jgi:hypothetical protein
VLQRFRERASADDVREFEKLRVLSDVHSQTRALEMVLFTLSPEELSTIGITAVGGPEKWGWAVAGSRDTGSSTEAVGRALASVPEVMVVGSHGWSGWYVPREHFFRARQAISSVTNLRASDVTIFELRFNLQ